MTSLTRTSSGYTLLELVLVLAILATMVAVIAPTLSGFSSGRKAENAARQFVALTRWVRSQAVTEGTSYQLVIDAEAGKWWVTVEDGEETYTEVPGPFGRVYATPEDVTLRCDLPVVDGKQTITFEASGRNDVGVLHFVGPSSDVEVACDTPVEEYRVIKDAEVRP